MTTSHTVTDSQGMTVSDELLSLLSLICIRTASGDLERLHQAEDLAASVAAALGFPDDGRRVPVTAEDIRQSLRRVEQRCERQVHRHEEKKLFRGSVVGWRHVGRRPLLDLDEVLRRLSYRGPLSLTQPLWDSPKEIGWVMMLALRMRPKLNEEQLVELIHRAFGEPGGPLVIEAQARIDRVRLNLFESGRLKTGRLSQGAYEVSDEYLEMGMERFREEIALVLRGSFDDPSPTISSASPGTREPRFVPPARSRQMVLDILTSAARPMSQEEIEREMQRRLEIPDEEALHVDEGYTRTRFSSIVVWRNGLQPLKDEGLVWQIGGQWTLAGPTSEPDQPGLRPVLGTRPPRYVPAAVSRQAVLEILTNAASPLSQAEIEQEVQRRLSIPDEEARYVEPGYPRPRFSSIVVWSNGLKPLRDEGTAKQVGGKWKLAIPPSGPNPTPPDLQGAPFPLAKDAAWPVLDLLRREPAGLSDREIDQRMHTTFKLDAGVWTFREHPSHKVPKFIYQMELARQALSRMALIELAGSDQWRVTEKGRTATASDILQDIADAIRQVTSGATSTPHEPLQAVVPPWPQGWLWPAVEVFRELAGSAVGVDVTNTQVNTALAERLQLSTAARSVGSLQFRGQYEYTTRFDAIRRMLRLVGAIEQGARVQPRPHHLLQRGLTITRAELEAEIAPIVPIVLTDYSFNSQLDALIKRAGEGVEPPPTRGSSSPGENRNNRPESPSEPAVEFSRSATAFAVKTHGLVTTEDDAVAPVREAGFNLIGWRNPDTNGTLSAFAYRFAPELASLDSAVGQSVRSMLPHIQAYLRSKFPNNGISVTGHVLAPERLGATVRQDLLAVWNGAGVAPVPLHLVRSDRDSEESHGEDETDPVGRSSAQPRGDDNGGTPAANEWATYQKSTGSNDSWVSGLIQEIHDAFAGKNGTPFERLCKALMEADPDVASVGMTHLSADQGADLICFDANGEETTYVQCKHWRSGGGSKYNTSPNNIAEFAGKINESYVKYLQHQLPVRAIWITTGDVDPSARSDITRRSLGSRVRYEIWGPEELCIHLLELRDIGFVRLRRAAGDDGLLREQVAVDRTALRAFLEPDS